MTDRTAGISKVGFIGTGVMGRSMASNLLTAGYALTVFNRTRSKAEPLLQQGAEWAPGAAAAAAEADCVISIVGFPADVRDIYQGEGGILAAARPGTVCIDMTTSEPSLARELAEAGARRGVAVLDAPVSGGDIGARKGALSIMVGGDPDAFERVRPLLEVMGSTIVRQGPAGSGQHCKMCNQITIAANMIGIMEALIYARRSGLDPKTVLNSIGAGAAASWSLSNLQPRVVAGDFAPGFYVCHFLKDIRIALAEAKRMGLNTPALELAERLYQELVDAGGADLGTQALYQVLEASSADAAGG